MPDHHIDALRDGAASDGSRFIALAAVILIDDAQSPAEYAALLIEQARRFIDAFPHGARCRLVAALVWRGEAARVHRHDHDLTFAGLRSCQRAGQQGERHQQRPNPTKLKNAERQPRGLPFACSPEVSRHAHAAQFCTYVILSPSTFFHVYIV